MKIFEKLLIFALTTSSNMLLTPHLFAMKDNKEVNNKKRHPEETLQKNIIKKTKTNTFGDITFEDITDEETTTLLQKNNQSKIKKVIAIRTLDPKSIMNIIEYWGVSAENEINSFYTFFFGCVSDTIKSKILDRLPKQFVDALINEKPFIFAITNNDMHLLYWLGRYSNLKENQTTNNNKQPMLTYPTKTDKTQKFSDLYQETLRIISKNDINTLLLKKDDVGKTLLCRAVENNNINVTKGLLEKDNGAAYFQYGKDRDTLLHIAATNNNPKMIQLLANYYLSKNDMKTLTILTWYNNNKHDPLTHAIYKGTYNATKTLLEIFKTFTKTFHVKDHMLALAMYHDIRSNNNDDKLSSLVFSYWDKQTLAECPNVVNHILNQQLSSKILNLLIKYGTNFNSSYMIQPDTESIPLLHHIVMELSDLKKRNNFLPEKDEEILLIVNTLINKGANPDTKVNMTLLGEITPLSATDLTQIILSENMTQQEALMKDIQNLFFFSPRQKQPEQKKNTVEKKTEKKKKKDTCHIM